MKKKQIISIVTTAIMVLACSTNVSAKQWITNLNAIQGGSCSSFGGGWAEFAYDGKSNIRFCKKTSSSKPFTGVLDAKGFHPGNIDCVSKFGGEWENFAYDGKADITFCMTKGDVDKSDNYIADVNAFQGNAACDGQFAGKGWDRIIYNGHSGITFCARFK
ncbi:MAG: hypothetical protein AB2788_13760 [Candidatus Thiodiazotropha endolucinida]